MRVNSLKDVEDIRLATENLCRSIGRKIAVIVNYDDFQIDENVFDDYSAMVKQVSDRYYTYVSRYTTSAFMRLKLGAALESRGLAAHIYETPQEAIDSTRPASALNSSTVLNL